MVTANNASTGTLRANTRSKHILPNSISIGLAILALQSVGQINLTVAFLQILLMEIFNLS